MKTNYIGKVVASWIVGRHREAKIDFGSFAITSKVEKTTEIGGKYRLELKKYEMQRTNPDRQ